MKKISVVFFALGSLGSIFSLLFANIYTLFPIFAGLTQMGMAVTSSSGSSASLLPTCTGGIIKASENDRCFSPYGVGIQDTCTWMGCDQVAENDDDDIISDGGQRCPTVDPGIKYENVFDDEVYGTDPESEPNYYLKNTTNLTPVEICYKPQYCALGAVDEEQDCFGPVNGGTGQPTGTGYCYTPTIGTPNQTGFCRECITRLPATENELNHVIANTERRIRFEVSYNCFPW